MATAFELPKTSIELGRQRIFVLHGTGGMGKTQIALKFINEYLDRYAYLSFSSHTFLYSTQFTIQAPIYD